MTAREKLESVVQAGLVSSGEIVNQVLSRTIQDRIVRTPSTRLVTGDNGKSWTLSDGLDNRPLHDHAFSQVIQDAGVPKRFADEMVTQANGTPWGAELVAHNINTIFSHRSKQRNLVRAEGNAVKGWLSDRFRRIDSRPLLESFVGGIKPLGLVPFRGLATDTKSKLAAILPRVFEPIPGEPIAFGLQWGNSDYGDGGHVLDLFILRVWCSNLAVGESVLRQIHLGKRLEDHIEYSDRTYQADTKANTLALGDAVRHAIGPAKVDGMVKAIVKANAEAVGSRETAVKILSRFLDKSDVEKAADAFDGPDVINLPPGNTEWRLSNAVSWIAQHKDVSPAKRMDLERVAGELLPLGKAKPLSV